MKVSVNDVRQLIFEGLRTALREPRELSDDDNFAELGVDSVAMMDLIMQIEEDLNIHLPLNEIAEAETVGGLVRVIASKLDSFDLEKNPLASKETTILQDIHELIESFREQYEASPASSLEEDKDSENLTSFSFSLSPDTIGVPKSDVWERVGRLLPTKKEKRIKILIAYFDASEVPESERPALIKKFEIEIARATRPKWRERFKRGGELAELSAPLFLRRVHAEEIAPDGTVENETIRAIDPDLMRAVDSYASNRRSRPDGDMGDAAGLQFSLVHPAKGNRGSRAAKLNL